MEIQLPFGLKFIYDPGQGAYIQFKTKLTMKHIRNGRVIKTRNLGSGVITTAGVILLAADYANTTATLKAANWHDSGTGTTTPVVGDTGLQTPTGLARVTGTQSSTNNIYQTQATLTYNVPLAITEWGLFTNSSGPTLFDHRTFTVQNVAAGDSLQFTWQLTVVAGG